MKIEQFTKQALAAFEVEALAAMKAVAEAHGVTAKIKSGSYGYSTGTINFEFTTSGGLDMEKELLSMVATRLGVDIANASSDGYTIVGYKAGKSKPWQMEKGGKQYSATDAWILQAGRFPKAKVDA